MLFLGNTTGEIGLILGPPEQRLYAPSKNCLTGEQTNLVLGDEAPLGRGAKSGRGGSRWEREGTPPRHFYCCNALISAWKIYFVENLHELFDSVKMGY